MNDAPITITLTREQVVILNDMIYEALHCFGCDDEQMAAFRALRDDLKRQLQEQRR